MSGPRRLSGRVLVSVLLLVAGLLAGGGGGYWLSRRPASAGEVAAPAEAGAEAERWYTCGMHPNVLQKGPGNCPICGMQLTPRKEEDEGEGAASGPKERKILYWRAPMDPGYISDKPGKSPMGMDLVPVYADEDESPSAHAIRIDPVTIQNMGIRTAVLKRGPLVKTIRTVGRIDYDEQLVTFINTKFEGWIEKLYVNETGQHVDKGQPLFDVYSPQLYSAQEEYLAGLRGLETLAASTEAVKEQARRLLEAARIKLEYLDVSDEQIDALRRAGEIQKTLLIHSPSRGIVTEKMALEGMYVQPGMKLYTIADLSRVWAYVDIYEYQLPWVRVGQQATMTLPYVPGREFLGKVVYIYPYLEKQTRVIKVRLEFENPTLELKPDMYANVTLEAELERDALLIPREAYIDSGKRQVAFVDLGGGKFQPRDIQVGVEAENGMVEVLDGLDEGEVVVTSGQFMLDAESKLKEAIAKMMEVERAKTAKRRPAPSSQPVHGHQDNPPSTGEQDPAAGIPPDAAYACPMETHPDESDPEKQGPYFAGEPGECPLCGMALKPIEELAWVKARKAAQGGDVAYTCPDHQRVFSATTGRCPRCGRELAPFKVMYTCPDPQHAGVISTIAGNCPHCGRGLAPYRGIWLDEALAEANVPPNPGLADVAAYRCPTHPLVHSDQAGRCTICGQPLEPTRVVTTERGAGQIPGDAKYTCPMEVCQVFSPTEGTCPKCGMRLKPIEAVQWASERLAAAPPAETPKYVCPMHPEQTAAEPGTCSICGMQLVHADALQRPQSAPARIAAQMDYITEHYLELQRLLASDRTADVALHALGLASASEELARHLRDPDVALSSEVAEAIEKLRTAALKTTGTSIDADRVSFVDLSAAMRTLLDYLRPDEKRWPRLFIYHCPMTKGDWVQATDDMANPYYGFKMLKCGKLQDTK